MGEKYFNLSFKAEIVHCKKLPAICRPYFLTEAQNCRYISKIEMVHLGDFIHAHENMKEARVNKKQLLGERETAWTYM